MFATLLSVALFILPFIQGVTAEFNIDTPDSITACQPITFNWEDTKNAPYNLVIVEATAPCGDILVELGDHSGTSFKWDKVVIPAEFIGKDVMLSLEDSNGEEAWSGAIPYKSDGAGDKCLKSSADASSTSLSGTTTIPYLAKPTSPTPSPTASGGAVAVGAANAGENPLSSGAHPVRQTSASVLLVSAFIALLALSL